MDLGQALAHNVLEGDGLRPERVSGPETEDAQPVFVSELGEVYG